MSEPKKTIAVLGDTGKEGGGLALRWAHAGHPVVIGGRSAERAEESAAEMRSTIGENADVRGLANPDAAAAADIVVLSGPFAAQQAMVSEVAAALAGKILIDVTIPLVPPEVSRIQFPNGGSAVEAVQKLLGEGVRVVSVFQNISAHHLTKLDQDVKCDVLVCCDDPAAAEEVVALAQEIGLTAWNAGPLCNSVVAEALTSVLISLTKCPAPASASLAYRRAEDNRRGGSSGFTVTALAGVPLVQPGDDLCEVVTVALHATGMWLEDGDVVVLAQKIVSKAEGRQVALDIVTPSAPALELAASTGKDARLVELILSEADAVIRTRPNLVIVRHTLGLVLANAGIDQSNVGAAAGPQALLLPLDPDASASRLRSQLKTETGRTVAVLIIDSLGRAWRMGTTGTAIGVAGMPAVLDLRGQPDLNGRVLESSELGLADEVAAAASLAMGQANEGTPIVIVRGLAYEPCDDSARRIVRPAQMDLFQ